MRRIQRVDLGHRPVGVRYDGRLARVRLAADRLVERQLSQKLGAVFLRHALGTARAEDVALVPALRADVKRHVLDDAEDRDADLLEHLEPLLGVDQRDVLRRGDDDSARHRHLLGKRQLDVPGARWQVDDQVVEIAPASVFEQLLQRLRDHRPAPHHGRVDVDKEADRDRLQAVAFHRLEALAILRFRPAGDAEHHGLRRPIDIRIEHADRGAFGAQGERQVHCGGGFADTAFARGDSDDVLDAGDELDAPLHGMRHDLRAHLDLDRGRAGVLEGLRHLAADRLMLALAGVAELDIERNLVAGHLDVARRACRHEVLAGVRVDKALQYRLDLCFGERHGLGGESG